MLILPLTTLPSRRANGFSVSKSKHKIAALQHESCVGLLLIENFYQVKNSPFSPSLRCSNFSHIQNDTCFGHIVRNYNRNSCRCAGLSWTLSSYNTGSIYCNCTAISAPSFRNCLNCAFYCTLSISYPIRQRNRRRVIYYSCRNIVVECFFKRNGISNCSNYNLDRSCNSGQSRIGYCNSTSFSA